LKPFLFKVSILYCFLFVLPQCTHLRRPTPFSAYQVCSSQKILQEFKEEENAFTCLKGIAKIRVESPEEKFSVKEIIIAKRPQCLRLETLNPLGHPMFFIVTDGKELSLFSPSENKFYQGIASSKNVSLFFHVNLSLEETISILLGKVPLIDYDTEQVECWMKGKFCVLKLSTRDKQFKQIIKLSLSTQKVLESNTYRQGEGLVRTTEFRRYERVGETFFPREITVVLPRDETRVRIHYKEIELLSEIDPDQFRLTPPQGVEVLPLE
jgi:outer membrane lipoprotein-sorting protein